MQIEILVSNYFRYIFGQMANQNMAASRFVVLCRFPDLWDEIWEG